MYKRNKIKLRTIAWSTVDKGVMRARVASRPTAATMAPSMPRAPSRVASRSRFALAGTCPVPAHEHTDCGQQHLAHNVWQPVSRGVFVHVTHWECWLQNEPAWRAMRISPVAAQRSTFASRICRFSYIATMDQV